MADMREYFDSLLRRTELPSTPETKPKPWQEPEVERVTIVKSEYDALLQSKAEYDRLKDLLVAGGIPAGNLQLLINSKLPAREEKSCNDPSLSARLTWSADAAVFVPRPGHLGQFGNLTSDDDDPPDSGIWQPTPCPGPLTPDSASGYHVEEDFQPTGDENNDLIELVDEKEDSAYFTVNHVVDEKEDSAYFTVNHEDRSLVFKGLSLATSLADVIKFVRGGQVLNAYLRTRGRERSAHVAFVEPWAAERFFMHSKRNDLYIRGKRVLVSWDERQHYMPGHIAHKIANFKATRNLVVRFANAEITAASIRDDLEHIHQLEVVDIILEDGHAYVSLNSINQAITAKSCMSSRLKYKNGCRIEFYPDECALPLPEASKSSKRLAKPPKSPDAPAVVSRNRFQMLAANSDDDLDELNKYEGYGRGDWTGPTINS